MRAELTRPGWENEINGLIYVREKNFISKKLSLKNIPITQPSETFHNIT